MSLASCSRLGAMRRRSMFVAALVAAVSLLVSSTASQAEGWKFWEGKETTVDDGVGGTPYANSTRQNGSRQSGYSAPRPSSGSSGGWNVGAGVSNAAKSVVNGTTNAASKTVGVTKRVAKKTVDIVTLKPLWGGKPAPSQFALGSHPDPRSKNSTKTPLWGTSSKSSGTPSTPGQFFSQPRVR